MRILISRGHLASSAAMFAFALMAGAVPAAAQDAAGDPAVDKFAQGFGCDENGVCGAKQEDSAELEVVVEDGVTYYVVNETERRPLSYAELAKLNSKEKAVPKAVTPRARAIPKTAQAPRPGLGAVRVDNDVYGSKLAVTFANGTARLEPWSLGEIEAFAKFLKQSKGPDGNPIRVRIEGHASATGAEERNKELSLERAAAVREKLIELEVNPDQLVAEGFGSAKPVDGYAATHGVNRRVEAILID
ncbi:MAG: OmpA family protein [Erythrobacter sp.]|jgi:outer membrane protein OmpA-like peptidoglycan-associated protein|nr:OmpA family protein [Erythrobacter sp.]